MDILIVEVYKICLGANRDGVHRGVHVGVRTESDRIRVPVPSGRIPQKRMEYSRFRHRRHRVLHPFLYSKDNYVVRNKRKRFAENSISELG